MSLWALATENTGKLREFSDLLKDFGVDLKPMSEFGVTGAEETGLSFVENAILKARHVAKHTGLPALADDSGLAVEALGGAPGIYSARYAEHGNDQANYEKLLTSLDGESNRNACFVSVLAVVRSADDPIPMIAQGLWYGDILQAPRGSEGFGYDPVFQPKGMTVSSAELEKSVKNSISHRALAVQSLANQLREQP